MSSPSSMCQKVTELGHTVDVFSCFRILSFPEQNHKFAFLLTENNGFPFLRSLPEFVVNCCLDLCNFDCGQVKSQICQNYNCNIQISKNNEHFFENFFEIFISSFMNSLLTSLAQFLTGLLVFLPLMVCFQGFCMF